MHAAKHLLTITISFLLIAGLVCARVCDMSCAYTVCETSTLATVVEKVAKNEKQVPLSGHCFQHEPESAPQDEPEPAPAPHQDNHSSGCQIHADPAAVESITLSKAASQQFIKAPAVAAYPEINISFDWLAGIIAHHQAFRSPPARAVFSVLRI